MSEDAFQLPEAALPYCAKLAEALGKSDDYHMDDFKRRVYDAKNFGYLLIPILKALNKLVCIYSQLHRRSSSNLTTGLWLLHFTSDTEDHFTQY